MYWSGDSPQAACQATVPVPARQDAVPLRKQLMCQLLKTAEEAGKRAGWRGEYALCQCSAHHPGTKARYSGKASCFLNGYPWIANRPGNRTLTSTI